MTTVGMTPRRLDEASVSEPGVSVRDLVAAARRNWRPCLVAGLIGLAIGVLVGIGRPKSYVARASFIPEQNRLPSLPSGLGALAAQFGLDVAGEPGRSPQFYRELLSTTGLLRTILDSVVLVTPVESLPVRTLFYRASDDAPDDVDRTLRRLRKGIAAQADARTSMVTFTVRTRTPR